MFKSKITDILSHVEVFDGLAKADLKIISKCCQRISFKKGETLIEIGQTPSAFYILIKGQLRVLLPERLEGRKEHRASEVSLNTLNEGDCFGESMDDPRCSYCPWPNDAADRSGCGGALPFQFPYKGR